MGQGKNEGTQDFIILPGTKIVPPQYSTLLRVEEVLWESKGIRGFIMMVVS